MQVPPPAKNNNRLGEQKMRQKTKKRDYTTVSLSLPTKLRLDYRQALAQRRLGRGLNAEQFIVLLLEQDEEMHKNER